MKNQIIQGDCLEVMRKMPDNRFDAIVTDPPYGLKFMGKKWDEDCPAIEIWAECLRILKPGGHLLAFSGTRTIDLVMGRIRQAGFEIRDTIMWLYGQGFPKSHNLQAEWEGWGTALKPACEPVTMARKPFADTVAGNMARHGVGALNIENCRIPFKSESDLQAAAAAAREHQQARCNEDKHELRTLNVANYGDTRKGRDPQAEYERYMESKGRWPANVIMDEEVGEMVDRQSEVSKSTGGGMKDFKRSSLFQGETSQNRTDKSGFGDTGGASRFFYCAKASRGEREAGLDAGNNLSTPTKQNARPCDWTKADWKGFNGNHHPTVKPIALMRYLVRLVTPPGGEILDPFTGSGTTLIAAGLEAFNYIGIEREPEYVAIAKARLAHHLADAPDTPTITKISNTEPKIKQLTLFSGEQVEP